MPRRHYPSGKLPADVTPATDNRKPLAASFVTRVKSSPVTPAQVVKAQRNLDAFARDRDGTVEEQAAWLADILDALGIRQEVKL